MAFGLTVHVHMHVINFHPVTQAFVGAPAPFQLRPLFLHGFEGDLRVL